MHSAHGDLAVTAAHCLTGIKGQIVFAPGYANGKESHGVWQVIAVYTDRAWQSSQDPDDDVAFLRLSDARGVAIEDLTGGERLSTGWRVPARVQVIGYPDGAGQPVSCTNWAKSFSPTQLEFDCGGYTDGTSGSPFLADLSAASSRGTVIGVIGGYEQGGDTPEVSVRAGLRGSGGGTLPERGSRRLNAAAPPRACSPHSGDAVRVRHCLSGISAGEETRGA